MPRGGGGGGGGGAGYVRKLLSASQDSLLVPDEECRQRHLIRKMLQLKTEA